ncbi:MAG: helix-turn-helix transcriptional regulator [Clostridia bacterium]|nr:helix-turn-helix transcriptional regulator [Clostridia bacterium]
MKLQDKILRLRKKSGLSQEALAEKIGVSRQAVSKWETGEAVPELSKLLLLARAFAVTTDYLLSEEETEPEQTEARPTEEALQANKKESYAWLIGVAIIALGAIIILEGVLTLILPKILGSFMFDAALPINTIIAIVFGIGTLLVAAGIIVTIVMRKRKK